MKTVLRTKNFGEQYSFSGIGKPLASRVTIITGVMRSGTSILAQIVGSLQSMEFSYEPWPFMLLAVLQHGRLIPKTTAALSIQKYCDQVLNDLLLGRLVNFREGEFSCIRNYRLKGEVEERWKKLHSRGDVRAYARSHQSTLLIKSTDMQPYYEFLYQALSGLKIIHIVRNGLDTALSSMKKGWYSDEGFESPEFGALTKIVTPGERGRNFHVPHFVSKCDAPYFDKANDFERCLIAWMALMKTNRRLVDKLKLKGGARYYELRYEDFVSSPGACVDKLCRFLIAKPTKLTHEHIRKVSPRSAPRKAADYPISELSERTMRMLKKVMCDYGYEMPGNE